jgi:hypothetical protein
LGCSGSEFLQASPPPKPKLQLASLAQRAAQPHNVLVLERPQPADHLACLYPCPALSDAEADRADDEAMRASPGPDLDDTISVVGALASHLASPVREATSICKGAAAVVAASPRIRARANPKICGSG